MNGPPGRVLLVGFMGSGKSRVGRRVAKGLGWSFQDFDEEIVLKEGLSIPEIFRQHGEAFFREVEERVGWELLSGRGVVLASGGGWPAVEGRMENLPPNTFTVWLKVTAEEAVRRAEVEGATRPLLSVSDPVARAAALLKERERFYKKARIAIDTTKIGIHESAKRIVDLVRKEGWNPVHPDPPYK